MQKIKERYRKIRNAETGLVYQNQMGTVLDIALAYPNTYYIGMSNLGFQSVYQLFNSYNNINCQRVFVPAPHLEKEFERIFEEFRRSETAGAVAGTGLGLPITKQLIDLMKGTIHLRSQLLIARFPDRETLLETV